MPVYPVTPSATKISGPASNSYILKNSGDVNVYLGQDSSLSVQTRAFTLPPGSTLNWTDPSTELWGITDPAALGEVELLYQGQNSFTPGPSNVTIGGPVKVDAETVTLASGIRTGAAYSADFDVSSFNTINIFVGYVGAVIGANNLECVDIQLTFKNATSTITMKRVSAIGSYQGTTRWEIPVFSELVSVTVAPHALATLNHQVVVMGTSRTIDRERFSTFQGAVFNGVSPFDPGNLSTALEEANLYFTINNLTAGGYVLLPGIYGEVEMFGTLVVTAGAIDFQILNLPSNFQGLNERARFGASATAFVPTTRRFLPRAPLILRTINAGATNEIRFNQVYN